MQTHKTLKKLFDQYLPSNYKVQICEKIGVNYDHKSKQKIYRVKAGILKDNTIMNALVDLAVNQKNIERRLLKKIK